MGRERKRKPQPRPTDDTQPADTAQPEAGLTPPAEELPPAPPDVTHDAPAPEEGERKWASSLPEPFGRHSIDLGDGRTLKLSRSNRWQQMRIEFVSQKDGVDPRPSKEDTEFLKQHGWRWRAEEKAWTRQLDRNTDDNRFARANSDRAAEDQFVTLANAIRARNGLEPVSYQIGNGIV